MLNLFVLVIIQQFEENYINANNPLENFKEFIEYFKEKWTIFTKKEHGKKLNQNLLVDFILNTKDPLGRNYKEEIINRIERKKNRDINLSKEEEIKIEVSKLISRMNLQSDNEGNIYFNQLLFSILHEAYSLKINENSTKEGLDIIDRIETKTLEKIEFRTKKVLYLLKKK